MSERLISAAAHDAEIIEILGVSSELALRAIEIEKERDALRAEVERLRAAMPSDEELDRVQFALSHAGHFPSREVHDAEDIAFEWLARVEAVRGGGA